MISADSTIKAPDGVSNSYKITEQTNYGDHQFGTGVANTADNTTYTTSIFLRPGPNITKVECVTNSRADIFGAVTFSLVGAGSIFATSYAGVITSAGIQKLPNNWYRVYYTFNSGTGTADPVPHFKHYDDGFGGVNYNAGTRAYYFSAWGLQTEVGSVPTSYISTSGGVIASRNADQLTISSLSQWYDRAVGTLFAQFINGGAESVSSYNVFGLFTTNASGTFANDGVMLMDSGITNVSKVTVSSASTYTAAGSLNTAGSVNKLAIAYADMNFGYTLNGANPSLQNTRAIYRLQLRTLTSARSPVALRGCDGFRRFSITGRE